MTSEERKRIFEKEFLTIADLQSLFDVGYQRAAKIMRSIRSRSDVLNHRGRCHIQDYYIACNCNYSILDRYPQIGRILALQEIDEIRKLYADCGGDYCLTARTSADYTAKTEEFTLPLLRAKDYK